MPIPFQHYRIAIASLIAMVSFFAMGQNNIDCEKAAAFLPKMQQKTDNITTSDPELISLHYLFVQDYLEEIQLFRTNTMPQLHLCNDIPFYTTKRQLDTLEQRLHLLNDTLDIQRKRIDTIFYEMAFIELNMRDTSLAEYYLDRSLQFNRLNTDALILKMKILFAHQEYDECIELIHTLYNEAPLNRTQENDISDFTALFYDKLFTTGDSLVKLGLAADALPLFESLATFCHNMPSSYCNDDYYHGIIRSKSGVYESYLVIAQVAWDKNNPEIAYRFIDYAEAYLRENPDEIEVSKHYADFVRILQENRWRYHLDDDHNKIEEQQSEPVKPSPQEQETEIQSDDETTPTPPAITVEHPTLIRVDTAQQMVYDKLLIDALYEYVNGNHTKAATKLRAAMEMENCNCIIRDERMQKLLDLLESEHK